MSPDIVDSATRSRMMARIRGRNTKPELAVRRYLHARGFRYRLHVRDLPGSPDIVLPRFRAAVFVHGCFWHRHPGCRFAYMPKSREKFWQAKFAANEMRDITDQNRLVEDGWRVIVVWECGIGPSQLEALADEIVGHG